MTDQQPFGDPFSTDPESPAEGALVFPKRARHMAFAGDKFHGVLGSAAPSFELQRKLPRSGGVARQRVTLLVNWFDT